MKFINYLKNHFILISLLVFFTVLVFYSSSHVFFWDTIQLGSKQAHFFFENNFQYLLLPNEIDSGHIPSFGIYLAFLWKLFGKTLFVSHLAMLPFVWGIVWQSYILIKRFIPKKFIGIALLIFLADPTLLSQLTLISPDVPLVFFFLLALNAILKKQRWFLMLALSGLFVISLRGVMVSVAILAIDIIFNVKFQNLKSLIIVLAKNSLAYLPGLFLFVGFSFYHYAAKGWIGYHDDSPWAAFFQKVSLSGVLRNILILGWRLIDFGRIFIWGITLVLLIIYRRSLYSSDLGKKTMIIFLVTFLSLAGQIIWFNNLVAHRYLLPVFLSFNLLALYLLFSFVSSEKLKQIISAIWLIGLITGNFWVYPDKVAQGWDSTLAHLPYYDLRSDIIDYLHENNIDIRDVGSDFPMTGPFKHLDLSDNLAAFPDKNFEHQKYILYSNIFNDFSDAQIDELQSNWKVVHRIHRCQVFFILYQKPQF